MWWLTLIWDVLTNLPKIIALIAAIIALIRNIKNPVERTKAMKDLQSAYLHAKETGDVAPLNKIHDDLCRPGGVGCPPTTLKE